MCADTPEYDDVECRCLSVDGHYRLTGTACREEALDHLPIDSGWLREHVFELHDEQNGAAVWRAVHRCSAPRQIWVSNRGCAAVLCRGDELFFVSPKGRVSVEKNVVDLLADDPGFERHAEPTDVNLIWDEAPIGYFFESDGRSCFCLRPHWGARLVFDTARREPLELNGAVADSARAAEENWIRARLTAGGNRLREEGGCSPESAISIELAAELAWREQFRSVIPQLRELETFCTVPEESANTPALKPGNVAPALVDPCCARRAVQEALLRLGERPAGRAVYAPVSRDGTQLAAPTRPEDWEAGLAGIQAGMQPHEVMKRAGMPFFAHQRTPDDVVWEYDILREGEVETARIRWKGGCVESIETLRPAPWLSDPYRCSALHRHGTCFCMTGFEAGGFGAAR